MASDKSPFSSTTAFCPRCGSILPLLQEFGSVKCYTCKTYYDADISVTNEATLNTDGPEGPVVERRCPKCGNDKMSYATLQLRSADEGQTVFYTCISCKYKETENS
ncbi:hypothetical protein O3G_MSEX013099 [Manduca sexta]|uniref:DNA-directed RNA polymerase subunit n=1 Tax=Manduca sexta TaxID=7130 RepID=A0A921ZQQ3_MANSE|nr:hypothetical protein O3G_MSEX013099 [Manduca sexta]